MRILIVDDEAKLRTEVRYILEEEGYAVDEAAEGHEALSRIRNVSYSVVLLDIRMPGLSGIDLIERIRDINTELPIIMISAYANIENIVGSVKNGAIDFIEKPYREERLLFSISSILEKQDLYTKNRALSRNIKSLQKQVSSIPQIIGESAEIKRLKDSISQAARHDVTVLITGESGTGKELVAQSIFINSQNFEHKMLTLNCASIQENLIESELFGHRKGAFTGAVKDRDGLFKSASGGTLFLDEIGEMPLGTQAKLLRALESQRILPVGADLEEDISVKLIAATNKNLEEEVSRGRFREDLFYRLDYLRIHTPPLRSHPEDIPLNATHFIKEFCFAHNSPLKKLSPDAVKVLQNHDWPGNVRELKNVLVKLITGNESETISALSVEFFLGKQPSGITKTTPFERTLRDATADFQKQFILEALNQNDGNVTETARVLGENRSHFYRRLKKLQIVF